MDIACENSPSAKFAIIEDSSMFVFKNQLWTILHQIPMDELSDELKRIFINLLNENGADEENDGDSMLIAEAANSDKENFGNGVDQV